ncbi:MAG: hypothetical protein B6U76_04030 [Desulfurococcales archaeon ex4484_217_2]|nr:MAG: hypothetical protein B6U76_04030 [Desulfurococcales archaeon ex4484_217_2]
MKVRADVKEYLYLALGVIGLILSYQFFASAISFMARTYIATSALSALIGFTFLAFSIQLFKLSAIAMALKEKEERKVS